MNKQQQIIDKIDSLAPAEIQDNRTKKVTITLPGYQLDFVKRLKESRKYKNISQTFRAILTDYFDRLLEEE